MDEAEARGARVPGGDASPLRAAYIHDGRPGLRCGDGATPGSQPPLVRRAHHLFGEPSFTTAAERMTHPRGALAVTDSRLGHHILPGLFKTFSFFLARLIAPRAQPGSVTAGYCYPFIVCKAVVFSFRTRRKSLARNIFIRHTGPVGANVPKRDLWHLGTLGRICSISHCVPYM